MGFSANFAIKHALYAKIIQTCTRANGYANVCNFSRVLPKGRSLGAP